MCSVGNAGYAVAYAGRKIGIPVTVVVPTTTPDWLGGLVRREAATVVVHGDSWDDAHEYGTRLAEQENAAYIHPFDDPRVWKGHSSIIHEIAQAGVKPGATWSPLGEGGFFAVFWRGFTTSDGPTSPFWR